MISLFIQLCMFSSNPFADPIISAPYLYVHYIVTKVNNNINHCLCYVKAHFVKIVKNLTIGTGWTVFVVAVLISFDSPFSIFYHPFRQLFASVATNCFPLLAFLLEEKSDL